MQDAVAARARVGERCDPLARGRGGSGAGCLRGGPELGGAAAGGGALLLGEAGGGERVECLLDALGGEVALAEVADLGARQPVGRSLQGGMDVFGERVAGRLSERPCGRALGVVPERERRLEMLGFDDLVAVEQGCRGARDGSCAFRRGR
jgi:hypothetical protein